MKSQFAFPLTVLVWVTTAVGKCPDDCNEQNFLYESFHCTPNCDNNDDCPISYDCSIIHQQNDTCFYNGKHYRIDERIEDLEPRDSCLGGCTCSREDDDNTTRFICYSGSCIVPHRYKDKCIQKQVLGECCSTARICPPFSKCILDGKTFEETENKFIHPKDNCKTCTCDRGEGVEGIINCQKRYCGDLLHHQDAIRRMCAPVYYRPRDCCPSWWICPYDKITFGEKPHGEEGPTCMFGDKILKKTQKFYTEDAVCECILPPFASCTRLSSD